MRLISFVLALAAASLIRPGVAWPVEATLEVYYWSYEEFIESDPDFVDEYSDPVFVSLGARQWDTLLHTVRALYTTEFGAGRVKYAGSGTLDGYYYYKFRGEAYAAYQFNDFSPFIGLGYRWLYDDGGGLTTSTGHSSYDRQSQYFYVPVGGIYRFTDDLLVKGQFNYLIYGLQTSYLSDIAGYSDIDNDQNEGWGVDLTIDYRVTKNIGVHTFFRYWDISDSDWSQGLINGQPAFLAMEPHNHTLEAGLGVSYKF